MVYEITKEHEERLETAKDYCDVALVAIEILKGLPQPIGQICGNISSGGKNSREEIEKNLQIFEKTICKLQEQGKIIFNQVPFEKAFSRIWDNDKLSSLDKKNINLLEGFYENIFKSGMVKTLYFIHGWEGSFGAKWEHDKASKLGLSVIYLEEGFHEQ